MKKVIEAVVASSEHGQRERAYLIRPPIYVTEKERALLEAKAVAANLVPPDHLPRRQRERARNHVLAELCRRAILSTLLGIHRFPEPKKGTQKYSRPLRALQQSRTIGGRFRCFACERRRRMAKQRIRIRRIRLSRKAAEVRGLRGREKKLLREVALLTETVDDQRREMRRLREWVEELRAEVRDLESRKGKAR